MKRFNNNLTLASIIILFIAISCSNNNNEFGLKIISKFSEYEESIKEDPNNELVDIENYAKGIQLDIRYATENNFTKKVIYESPKAYLRKPVAQAIAKVQKQLFNQGYGLKIFDAYRPYSATVKFYEVYPDTNFVAAPWKGSVHNRGCAVDLTLVDIKMEDDFQMPTEFDDFSEKASHNYKNLPSNVIINRKYLLGLMEKHGFVRYDAEWWHYSYKGWDNYDLMDISIDELSSKSN